MLSAIKLFFHTILLFTALFNVANAVSPCPSGWSHATQINQCYLIPNVFLSYEAAKNYCGNVTGGELVSIYSQEENDAVLNYMKEQNFVHLYPLWIGLQYTKQWPYYQWLNQRSLNYTNWINGSAPNDVETSSCFAWKSTVANSGWTTLNCKYAQPFICKQHAANCLTKNVNGTNGTITSPNYPDLYDLEDICVYHITVPQGNVVHLKFNVVSIDMQSIVNVFDGSTPSSPLLGHAMQDEWDWYGDEEFEGTTNVMTLSFVSGRIGSSWNHGWTADFTAVSPPTPTPLNGLSGSLTSPNYPNQYNSSDKEFYSITAPPNYQISFTIWDFLTESSYDWLRIYEEGKELINWSGSAPKQLPYTFSTTKKSCNILWSTNMSYNYRGFNLTWVATPSWG